MLWCMEVMKKRRVSSHTLHSLKMCTLTLLKNLDYLMRGNSVDIHFAALGAMRKLTAQESIQEAFIAILGSNPQEFFVVAIAKSLFTGQEHSNVMGMHINENPHLLNALVTSSLSSATILSCTILSTPI